MVTHLLKNIDFPIFTCMVFSRVQTIKQPKHQTTRPDTRHKSLLEGRKAKADGRTGGRTDRPTDRPTEGKTLLWSRFLATKKRSLAIPMGYALMEVWGGLNGEIRTIFLLLINY